MRYQSRLIRVFDSLAKTYDIQMIDASRPPEEIFQELQASISKLFIPQKGLRKVQPVNGIGPALTAFSAKSYNKASS